MPKKKILILFFLLTIAISCFITPKQTFSIECTQENVNKTKDPHETEELKNACQKAHENALNQGNSLRAEIQRMDTQIYLTQLQIQDTEQKIVTTQKEIDTLGDRINNLDSSLNKLTEMLRYRVVKEYKEKSVSVLTMIIDSATANDFITHFKYLKTAQENNQRLIVQVQQQKLNFEEQKTKREEKEKELNNLIISLNNQKADLKNQQINKQRLLQETNNDESRYSSLFAQAQAQLAGFSHFVSSQGGASILTNQTACDDWGCYYNQRDSQWGSILLNGVQYCGDYDGAPCDIAHDGCLLTSMAMIYTHYGHKDINPLNINSNPNNFASYNRAFLNMDIVANGISASRDNLSLSDKISSIDSELNSGRPVIVEIIYDGNTHFIVLISGSNGNYKMNDPFIPNGHNISFADHYSLNSIGAINKVSM